MQINKKESPYLQAFQTIQRKLGDSNPRYGYPYGSLANCWFQPLTQTSIGIPRQSIFSQMRVQRYELFSILPNFIATISSEK